MALSYLGVTLYPDGRLKNELGRKLGASWAEFCKLRSVWNHSTLNTKRKVEIFNAVIVSRLLYGLQAAWVNVAEQRRLNGFHARCLRSICHVKPSFVSRVSNADVLKMANEGPLTQRLLEQQLKLFGKIARAPAEDELRKLTFLSNSLTPATYEFVRRVGRPRHEWASRLQHEAGKVSRNWRSTIHNIADWEAAVRKHCRLS